ncbi:hypothetical protein BHE74_00047335, partial [Ensete ventricosum]
QEENEEGISGSIAPRILDFDDDAASPLALLIYDADDYSSSSSATAAAANTGTSASTAPRCWDDVVSFSPFPSLDALFDTTPAQQADPVPAVCYPSSTSSSSLNPPLPAMFAVPPPYAGNHHLNPSTTRIPWASTRSRTATRRTRPTPRHSRRATSMRRRACSSGRGSREWRRCRGARYWRLVASGRAEDRTASFMRER